MVQLEPSLRGSCPGSEGAGTNVTQTSENVGAVVAA